MIRRKLSGNPKHQCAYIQPCPEVPRMYSMPGGGGGGHSHQLSYGGVPLYRVAFERPISLK